MARRKIKRKVIIRNGQSPGDIVMLTAAVRDLYLSHPEIGIDPRTSAGELWENNPYIVKLEEDDKDVEDINVDYPLIHTSNEGQHHFIHGYRKDLEDKLDVDIEPTKFKGDIHISDTEKGWISQVEEMEIKNEFWILMAGGKTDYTCVVAGSRVQTKHGYKKIEDITADDEILTEWGYKKSDGAVLKGKKNVLHIKTKLGGIHCTPEHRFKIMSDSGNIKWQKAKDIKEHDFILCKRGSFEELTENEDEDVDKWFATGRLWGDGFLNKRHKYKNKTKMERATWIFSENEPDSKKRVYDWLKKIKGKDFCVQIRKPKGNRTMNDYRMSISIRLSGLDLPSYMQKGKWRSDGFPESYFNLGKKQLKAFLQGLFSADGTTDKKGGITYTTIYKEFAENLRKLLWQCGITSSLQTKSFISQWNKKCTYYRITLVGSKSYSGFGEKIGFDEGYKDQIILDYIKNLKISPADKFHGIPHAHKIIKSLKTKKNATVWAKKRKPAEIRTAMRRHNVIRDSVMNNILTLFDIEENGEILLDYIKNDWYFDQVINIKKKDKKQQVYDILNSETESYVVNGFVSHNCKWSNPYTLQKVIDHFKGKITFVQCGMNKPVDSKGAGHYHPELKNVVNLIDKTDLRQFIRLVYHSVGVLCPVTFAMHAAAAIEMKNNPPINRPCVVIAGGREPPQWEAYPNHRFLATNGAMDCCDNGGCWKSRCQTVGDGDKKDIKDLCLYPVKLKNKIKIPKCMDMIKDADIIRAIEMYYEGGVLKYNDSKTVIKVEGGVL